MHEFLLKLAIEAAVEAGKRILKIYNRDFEVEIKADASPLTEADLASNATLLRYLETTGIPIISEETKQVDYEIRKHWKSCWIIDPLDGTKEFIKRNDEFTVNVALVEKGIPRLGVIYTPVLKTLYYTDTQKQKAYKTLISDRFSNVKFLMDLDAIQYHAVSSTTVRVVASRSHLNPDTEEFIERLRQSHQTVETVSKGSSLKFCLVAEGLADVYPRFAPTMEWDTAAGQAICEAVGLQVLDLQTNKPMVYNRNNLLNNSFLVTKNGAYFP